MKLNSYFDKIYVINLYDQEDKWKKVRNSFKRRGIDAERFIAIDGRCKGQGIYACKQKARSFEIAYQVDILTNKHKYPYKVLLPACSLTIGTILLLRNMVKKKYKRILICEDDIILGKDFVKKFNLGLSEIGNKSFDMLYLGCGGECGNKGLSRKQERDNYPSQLLEFIDDEWYVKNKNDLRMPCYKCTEFSKHISYPDSPGGTWCYAVSLKGAKKILKLIDNKVYNHIDEIYQENANTGRKHSLEMLAFNPPIAWHEYGAFRGASNIPWKW